MNLHAIAPAVPVSWTRLFVQGGNGRSIDVREGRHVRHVFRISRRQDIPALGNRMRQYWYPWRLPEQREVIINPVCGPLKTRAQLPTLSPWTNNWREMDCPECAEYIARNGITPRTLELVQRDDPWMQLAHLDRIDTIDPISGR